MIALAVLPALRWAKKAKYGLPLFEAFMLTNLGTYAVPLLTGQKELRGFDTATLTTSALVVLVYQLTANATYLALRARPKRTRFWRQEVVSGDVSRFLGYGMVVTTIYTVVAQFTDWIPYEFSSIARAGSYGLGIIATFMQSRRWGENDLPYYDKVIFAAQVVIQVIFSCVSLFLVTGIGILLVALLGYVSSSKKIPLVTLAITVPLLAILHNGKGVMRAKYWDEGGNTMLSINDMPSFFTEWIGYGLTPQSDDESSGKSISLLQRTSLFQMVCLAVSISPDHKPFLAGDTYSAVLAEFVPRILWMGSGEKPHVHAATYEMAIYYGIQNPEDTLHTTIGFGTLTEAYANFGFYGAVGIGLFFATFFRKISGWASESPMLSFPGVFMVLLMAWSFQTELPLSDWLGSLYQASVVGLGIPFVWKHFFS